MMHHGRLHGHMRKKLCCVNVGLTYPKTAALVTRGRMLDFSETGASDEDYYARALVDYEAETGTTFKLRHCWEILKGSQKWMKSEVPKFTAKSWGYSKRYKPSGSRSFNTESGEASINLNANVGDDEEDEVKEIRRPNGRDKAKDAAKKKGPRASGSSSMNDEALARLMVTKMANQEKEERLAFLKIKRIEVECHERKVRNQECRQHQDDIRFYLQSYDYLIGDARMAMKEPRGRSRRIVNELCEKREKAEVTLK
ncbi:gamma-glutamyltranspeptidase 1 [Tanacetum coccineum]